MDKVSKRFDYIILGGGSAGCTLANRLSTNQRTEVLLVEAGKDFLPGEEPQDILDSYPMGASFNPEYHWQDLRVKLGYLPSNQMQKAEPRFMEQARLIGGGSSINAQMANRGSPMDYDEWEKLGAKGWNWEKVLPYFRKLENDENIVDDFHGQTGPIKIRRVPEIHWPDFTKGVAQVLADSGYKNINDQNGYFEDGWFPCTISNSEETRVSASMGYLNTEIRRRKNLKVMAEAKVDKIIFEGRRAVGAIITKRGKQSMLVANQIVVSAGALHTPVLLMRSGIGRAAHLKDHGIEVIADLAGVGMNLNEHPTIAVSAYLKKSARLTAEIGTRRHAQIAFRYTSGIENTGPSDMYVSVTAKSGWHAVGQRLGSFLMWCNKPYSRGQVELQSGRFDNEPAVDFKLLSDRRDYERLADGIRRMASYFGHPKLRGIASDPFPSCYSERVRRIGAVNTKNRILTNILAGMMDGPAPLRRLAVNGFITMGVTLSKILKNENEMEEFIREGVTGCWHPSGTARMGASDDPLAVTNISGKVYGVDNLIVCDASLFPCVPRANTNIPTIMCAEKIADEIQQS